MKRLALLLILLFIALGQGCSWIQPEAENQVAVMLPNGKVVTHQLTDEAMYYHATVQKALARRPILTMEAKEGETIELRGVKNLVVWGYDDSRGQMPAYTHPWAMAFREWGGLVGNVANTGLLLWGINEVAGTIGGAAGTHINHSFNPSGAQSPPMYLPQGNGTVNMMNDHRRTKTTTDSHNDNSRDLDGQ